MMGRQVENEDRPGRVETGSHTGRAGGGPRGRRRRILLLLMLLGNAGIVTAVMSLLLGFINPGDGDSTCLKLAILLPGVVLLWVIASSSWVDRYLSRLMSWTLRHWTDIEVRDYASLLRLTDEYSVKELRVDEEDWLANRMLKELKLRDEGVSLLGLTRKKGDYIGAPRGHTEIRPGDTLILYGRTPCLTRLDRRDEKGMKGIWSTTGPPRNRKR